MSNSILTSTKVSLDIPPAHTAFDGQILMHINSALATLTQLGVGPEDGFSVATVQENWADFISDDKRLNPVKTYIHLRVKMLFDPPEIGFVITEMRRQIEELEWRLNVTVDNEVPLKEVPLYDYDSTPPRLF